MPYDHAVDVERARDLADGVLDELRGHQRTRSIVHGDDLEPGVDRVDAVESGLLTQLAAVEKAVKAISREIMQDHLETCVVEQVQAGNTEIVGEVMDLLRKFS
ncbi:MAG: metal-sensing transcriptional repressor [Atopobiaceae bacterium]|nr:metal-sensing transcriptional repressor [Atopobiaceae bacterium]